jgi:8-oxo-dGTP pyrophosphatase MutT (NUDIX family)
MLWKNLGEQPIHHCKWFKLNLADVELPDGRRLDHYVLHQPPVALCAVVNADDEVLLLWRHRFILDTYGWELPSGGVEPGESLHDAALRETEEETGWRPNPLQPLITLQPNPGLSDNLHVVFWADGAKRVGEPVDDFESDRVEWVPLTKVPDLIATGEIKLANTVAALLLLCRMRGL